MTIARLSFLVLSFAALTPAWAGPSPVGAWTGKIIIDASKMTLKDPNQVKMAKQQIAAAELIKITLTFKADKTFTGNPPPTTGTWTQKGNEVTLTVKGKPSTQVFVFSKDGKILTNTLPANQGISGKIVLKKG